MSPLSAHATFRLILSGGGNRMQRPRIVVVGSSNTDMVVTTPRLPRPGETLLGGRFLQAAGGKGANQAVAAARAGARVTLVARVGDDLFGRAAIEGFEHEGIDTRYVSIDPDEPSGVALILVDGKGENLISVAPGANATLQPCHVDQAAAVIAEADLLLTQLETPLTSVRRALEIAQAAGVPVLLNPAPAPTQSLPEDLFAGVSVLTPNRVELAQITGRSVDTREFIHSSCKYLLDRGTGSVVVTLGAEGAAFVSREGVEPIPPYPVSPLDTVGAGDCFSACLAVALAEGRPPVEAACFAAVAAALSTTRTGAQPSMPARAEVDAACAGTATTKTRSPQDSV